MGRWNSPGGLLTAYRPGLNPGIVSDSQQSSWTIPTPLQAQMGPPPAHPPPKQPGINTVTVPVPLNNRAVLDYHNAPPSPMEIPTNPHHTIPNLVEILLPFLTPL